MRFYYDLSENTTGMALNSDTDPALLSYGFELSTPDGLPTHSGQLATSISMDSKTGQFFIEELKPDASKRNTLLRITTVVESRNGDNELKRYTSDPIPLIAGIGNNEWTKTPEYDSMH